MKKSVCLALTSLLAAATLTGCADKEARYKDFSYTSPDALSAVCVDVRDRAVEISVSDDDKVHIIGFESDKEGYNIEISEDGTLKMTIVENKEWNDFIGTKAPLDKRKITLKAPGGLLNSLSVSTTKATPHKDCAAVAPSDFSSNCTMRTTQG